MDLPDLVLLPDYDAENYINVVYQIFRSTLVKKDFTFLGLPITYPWHPSYDGKHFCFWHLITKKFESDNEEDRQPDIRRCERIRWIAYVFHNLNNFEQIWCWETKVKTKRGRSKHVVLYLHEEHYVVILRRKQARLELVTTYVKRNHHRMMFERDKYSDPRTRR